MRENPQEQEKFYQIFDGYLAQLQRPLVLGQVEEDENQDPEQQDLQDRIKRTRKWLYAGVLSLLIGGIIGWQVWKNKEQPLVEKIETIEEIQEDETLIETGSNQ